jgi:tetratricopeptide (TPR) repeat protein
MWGQIDKKEVRRGNREFKKDNYEAAFQDYLRAVGKDTSSIAANYNMASALYRMEQYDQAQQALDRIKESAPSSASAADYLYNLGDVALQRKDYQAAVKAFGESLILRPDDLDAKENFIYARKMLQNQQQNDQNQNNNDQNQDNNGQNQDQNKNEDQNQENDQNDQDRQNDQNKDNQQENQNQQQNDKPQNQEGQPQNQEAQITPQAAQQMLQAIQAKEKETQDKVNKKKAMALKSRQKDKNW